MVTQQYFVHRDVDSMGCHRVHRLENVKPEAKSPFPSHEMTLKSASKPIKRTHPATAVLQNNDAKTTLAHSNN